MAVQSVHLPPLPALMAAPAGISARYLSELLPAALPAPWLTQVGIDPQRLRGDEHYRVPLYQAYALLEQALAAQPDPLLALRQARQLSLKAYPWLGLSLLASTDLGTGLARLIELEPLVWDGSRIELSVEGESASLRWLPLHAIPPAVMELALAGWVLLAPALAGVPAGELRLGFTHAARAPLAAYRELLGCEPQFDQPATALRFPAAWLRRELKLADPSAADWVLAEARRRLAEGPLSWRLELRLRAACFAALPGELPEASALADALGLSARGLRERLQAQNLNLRALQDEVRRDAACWWLRHSQAELVEIAQACGFSEQSAFQRAFRRWTGSTPAVWRQTRAA
jgi:AraC-like DNA-binding protein